MSKKTKSSLILICFNCGLEHNVNQFIFDKHPLEFCNYCGYDSFIPKSKKYFTALIPSNFVSKDLEDFKGLIIKNRDLLPQEVITETKYDEAEYLDDYYF